MRTAGATLALLVCACGSPAGARILESGPGHFILAHTVTVPLPPAQTWARLIDLPRWWDGAHSWSGDARNLRLDPRAGGLWAEVLPGGGSVEHARVLHADLGRLLRVSGGLGPLQSEPVSAVLTITLKPVPGGTEVAARYAVAGALPGGAAAFAAPVDSVITAQFDRLARLNGR